MIVGHTLSHVEDAAHSQSFQELRISSHHLATEHNALVKKQNTFFFALQPLKLPEEKNYRGSSEAETG